MGEGASFKVTHLLGSGAGEYPGLPSGGLLPGKVEGRDRWMDRQMGGALTAGLKPSGLGSYSVSAPQVGYRCHRPPCRPGWGGRSPWAPSKPHQ